MRVQLKKLLFDFFPASLAHHSAETGVFGFRWIVAEQSERRVEKQACGWAPYSNWVSAVRYARKQLVLFVHPLN